MRLCKKRRPNSRKSSNAAQINTTTRWFVYKRDDFKCHICGTEVDTHCDPNDDWAPSLDHVMPKAQWPKGRRGVNHADNLRTAHRICNSHKHTHNDADLPEHIVRRILSRVDARSVA